MEWEPCCCLLQFENIFAILINIVLAFIQNTIELNRFQYFHLFCHISTFIQCAYVRDSANMKLMLSLVFSVNRKYSRESQEKRQKTVDIPVKYMTTDRQLLICFHELSREIRTTYIEHQN